MQASLTSTVRSFSGTLFDLFYPLYCGGCNTPGYVLCAGCVDSFRTVDFEKTCPVCGRHVGSSIICGACTVEKHPFRKGYFGFYFEGRLREAIHAFKFHGRLDAGRALIRLLEKKLVGIADTFDSIVPLPVSERRLFTRGFNQSYIIAEEIGGITGRAIYPSSLAKIRKTEDQFALSRKDRKKNVRNAFAVRDAQGVEGKRVLLVDDLFTTGYTAHEAARCLMNAAAREVILFALARTPS